MSPGYSALIGRIREKGVRPCPAVRLLLQLVTCIERCNFSLGTRNTKPNDLMQGYDKKCECSQKRLVECKLFEKCKGAKEQQLVECNLFNHLPATSCQSSHNQLGGGGVLKVQPAYSFRLNSHSQPAFSCLAASSNSLPSPNNQTSFCLYAKRYLVM